MTGLNSTRRCVLCNEVSGQHALSTLLSIPLPVHRVLIEDEDFLVLRDICPLIPGHYLLISREHLCSFGDLPATKHKTFSQFKLYAADMIGRRFARPILFEHGSRIGSMAAGACVEHAHIHLIPVSGAPVTLWMEEFGDVKTCTDPAAPSSVVSSEDYLFYEDDQGVGSIVLNPSPRVPHQFIRRQMGQHLDIPDWNWKTVFRLPDSAPLSSGRGPDSGNENDRRS